MYFGLSLVKYLSISAEAQVYSKITITNGI